VTKTDYITVTEAPPVVYCVPENIIKTGDYIKSVTLGSISTSNSSSAGYSINAGPYSLNAGATYAVTLTPNTTSSRNFWRIWLDANGDKDFTDTGETLLAVNNKKGAFTASITIPASSSPTRLRISMRTGSSPAPCDNGFAGEVEDYGVTIGASSSAIKNASMAISGEAGSFRLYPNPATHRVMLELGEVYSGDSYSLYNILGELMVRREITGMITPIELDTYASGIFMVVISNGNQVYRGKIIKQ
jgi:hypothetical protein